MSEEVTERFGQVLGLIIETIAPDNPHIKSAVLALLLAIQFDAAQRADQITYEFFWRDQRNEDIYADMKAELAKVIRPVDNCLRAIRALEALVAEDRQEGRREIDMIIGVLRDRGFFDTPDNAEEQADAAGA